MNEKQRRRRFLAIKCLGCLACARNVLLGFIAITAIAEVHHQNEGGHAGGERLGDEFTVGLCAWHHRGEPPFPSMSKTQAARLYGPSLKEQPRLFRDTYGSDEDLLARQNRLIDLEIA